MPFLLWLHQMINYFLIYKCCTLRRLPRPPHALHRSLFIVWICCAHVSRAMIATVASGLLPLNFAKHCRSLQIFRVRECVWRVPVISWQHNGMHRVLVGRKIGMHARDSSTCDRNRFSWRRCSEVNGCMQQWRQQKTSADMWFQIY